MKLSLKCAFDQPFREFLTGRMELLRVVESNAVYQTMSTNGNMYADIKNPRMLAVCVIKVV